VELFAVFYRISIGGSMETKRTDLLRGTLDLLVLKALSLEPLHGVAISRRITQITRGAFQVSFGSLFPSLHRMEEKGWVEAEWRASENNRRDCCRRTICLLAAGAPGHARGPDCGAEIRMIHRYPHRSADPLRAVRCSPA
jgi:hypothetical protein